MNRTDGNSVRESSTYGDYYSKSAQILAISHAPRQLAWKTSALEGAKYPGINSEQPRGFLHMCELPWHVLEHVLLLVLQTPGHPRTTCFAMQDHMSAEPEEVDQSEPSKWEIAGLPSSALCRTTFARMRMVCTAWRRLLSQFVSQVKLREVWGGGSIATAFPCIQELDLTGCARVSDQELSRLPTGGLPASLTSLHLCGSLQVTDVGLAALSGLTALKDLALERCHRVSEAALTRLPLQHPKLQILHLLEGVHVSNAVAASLAACTDLVSLTVAFNTQLTDAGLLALAAGPVARTLHTLMLYHCSGVDGYGVRDLTQLRTLHLNWCDGVRDDGLLHGVSTLTYLQELGLKMCWQVTANGTAALSCMSSLHALDLSGCESLDDAAVSNLSGLCSLERLSLWGCHEVSDASIAALGRSLTQLRALNLAWVPLITDAAVISLRRLRLLEKLDLTCCQNISDASLMHLARNHEHLHFLGLQRCQVTTEGIQDLVQMRGAELTQLDLRGTIVHDSMKRVYDHETPLVTPRSQAVPPTKDAPVAHPKPKKYGPMGFSLNLPNSGANSESKSRKYGPMGYAQYLKVPAKKSSRRRCM
eukprot:CAMPEP_0114251070 /NCGR_PEP_ID=MMETSP0058-20121206/15063_1 /TAXON_ID=36894 /ORGANISM="Pyramimonas parkeae, CCMP726" /LENGTH=589 /DNA_ID=CAMNT_0001364825 /DNA_START=116 /DNA_END=1885 /DNA_ORIENTATION=-